MNADGLFQTLKKSQESKGYYFNRNTVKTKALLDALLTNKERYGYMSCPCRLAKKDRDLDKDIICPCDYRKDDVKEYGSCYCGLYVSVKWNKETLPQQYVPERRPVEKC